MNHEKNIFGTAKKIKVLNEFIESEALFVKVLNYEIRKYEQTKEMMGAIVTRLKEIGKDREAREVYNDMLEDVSVRLRLLGELEKLYHQDLELDKELLKAAGLNINDHF